MVHTNTMIAFVGTEHVRKFERMFNNDGYDLWAFGHRKRRSSAISFGQRGDIFTIFDQSHHKHLLILYELHHIPLLFNPDIVMEYYNQNNTVATLWPRFEQMPTELSSIQSFISTYNIEIKKIQL